MAEEAKPTSIFQDFDRWWFGRGSPVTLGVFRILFGLLAFVSLAMTLPDFGAFYTEKGFVPAKLDADWTRLPPTTQIGSWHIDLSSRMDHFPRISLLNGVTNSNVTLAFYLIVMFAAVLTALGLWTRISSICLAVGLISIHHRNPLILHSGDTLLRCSLCYLALSPCGKACSLDRLIGLWKGKAPLIHTPVSLWSQRLIQYQTSLVYFTTIWWKWFGTDWKDGTATFYPARLHEFDRFPIPGILEHQPFVAITTYGTLIVELSIATLIYYKPLRRYVVISAILMHSYIEYRFNIPMFAMIICSTYLCFYEGPEVIAFAKRLGERLKRFRIRVKLPAGYELKSGPGMALNAMDPLDLVTFEQGEDRGWAAEDQDGNTKSPFWSSWKRSIGAIPIGLIPSLWHRLLDKAIQPLSTAMRNGESAVEAKPADAANT